VAAMNEGAREPARGQGASIGPGIQGFSKGPGSQGNEPGSQKWQGSSKRPAGQQ